MVWLSGRMKKRFAAVFLGTTLATPLAASDIEQRLERLEVQMQRLLERLDAQDIGAQPAVPEPSPTGEPTSRPAMTPAVPAAPEPEHTVVAVGEVRVRYYLVAEPMVGVPSQQSPLSDRLFTLHETLRFDPETYGAAERGVLSRYRDHGLYRSAGVLIEGVIDLPVAGTYVFHVAPKPAREGGGSPVANELSLQLEIAGRSVVAMNGVRSWRNQTYAHDLPAGSHVLSLWAVVNSPGYGPAAIDSRLEVTVAVPGRAGLLPLSRLVRSTH